MAPGCYFLVPAKVFGAFGPSRRPSVSSLGLWLHLQDLGRTQTYCIIYWESWYLYIHNMIQFSQVMSYSTVHTTMFVWLPACANISESWLVGPQIYILPIWQKKVIKILIFLQMDQPTNRQMDRWTKTQLNRCDWIIKHENLVSIAQTADMIGNWKNILQSSLNVYLCRHTIYNHFEIAKNILIVVLEIYNLIPQTIYNSIPQRKINLKYNCHLE